jgi:transcriptional regulator with XRE-family HTH domain
MRPARPGLPYANTAVAVFIDKRIDELRGVKTQRELAAEAGFVRPNILSMFKRGETKVPLDRVAALAKALDTDPAHLFRLAAESQWPELTPVISQIFGGQLASINEAAVFLDKWRAATGGMDPAPNAQINAAVDRMLAELGEL